MNKRTWLPILLLATAVAALTASAFVSRSEQNEESHDATFAEGALRQRLLMMRDARGRIPPDAWGRAKAQAERLRARGRRRAPGAAAAAARTAGTSTASTAATSAPGVPWRWLGPFAAGGRIRTLAIHPLNPSVLFAGSAGGGIWKSTDAGASWAPCDDFMPALSVSSIVFDPRDPSVLYAGTGEAYHNADAIQGAGIFRSADGGASWQQLPATAPSANPDFRAASRLAFSVDGSVLMVATSGGVYRSIDRGASFTKTVWGEFTQVAFSPVVPGDVVATGYTGGVAYSRDGGQTWAQSSGFASVFNGTRIELAYAKSDGSIYASVDVNSGTLYRSVDRGVSFGVVPSGISGYLSAQGWYDNAIWVDPFDANHVIVGGVNLFQTEDGGRTFATMSMAPLHPDQHVIVADLRYDNSSNSTVYVGNDGGVFRTTDVRDTFPNATNHWEVLNNGLGVTQFYGADANATTGVLIGGTQDNGAQRYNGTWKQSAPGDAGFVSADQLDARFYYWAVQWTEPYRTADGGDSAQSISSGITDGTNANFIGPVVLDPNNRRRLYVGKNNLWRTDTADASATFFSVKPPGNGYISAIAVTPGDSNGVWVGHNSGLLVHTTSGASTTPAWTAVWDFQNYVSRITIDPANPNAIFVSRTGFQPDNVWRSIDGGVTWASASGSGETALPDAPVYDLQIDPGDPATIYAATEVGVFRSTDRGATWEEPGLGPANTRVTELFWLNGSLVAATHGRGIFALDVGAAGTGAPVPAPWRAQDVGAVGVAGRSTFANGTFTLAGAGADVWGSADAFQFVFQPLTGDGTIVARVASVQPVAPWTKAGVMIRQALSPGAAHAFMIVSAGKGLAFQRRSADGGVTTSTSGMSGAAPLWVRISRSGTTVTASYSPDGSSWTAAGQDTIDLGSTAYVGLVVSSHDSTRLATVTFDNVSVAAALPPPTGSLPAGWTSGDIGAVGAAGRAAASGGTFTIAGAGADIWGSADAFRYAYYPLQGDGTIVARVAALDYVAAWTKAGVMFRQSVSADSAQAMMLVSAGKGTAFQRRTAGGGLSTSTAGDSGTAPRWLKLVRAGQTVSAYVGTDGAAWTLVGQDTLAFSGTIWAGLAVSSHDASTTATATFDNVSISATGLPTGWQDADVGSTGVIGSAVATGGVFTVRGGGADVWGTSDALNYAFTTLPGDGEIVAHVASVEYVASWTKAGVMIRGSLDPAAPQALMLVSPGKGLAFQRRVAPGASSTSTPAGTGTAPAWVRLIRAGTTISAYVSADGAAWSLVAQDSFAITGPVYVGLAVSSHDVTRLAAATFDNVAIR